MKRPDLANRQLVVLVAAAALMLVAYFALVQRLLPEAWRTPGSPPLYAAGVCGAALLLVSMGFVLVKRSGRGGSPPAWFVAHVLGGTAGAVLVAIHSAGFLRRPPALLFLCLIALVVLGLWGRVRLAPRMAGTFSSRAAAFAPADAAKRERCAAIIRAKRALLAQLDRRATEATFSLTAAHLLRAPRLSYRYARLVRAENRLIGTRASVGLAQAWWRPLHLAIAWLFLIGLVAHVVTVTFFID